MCWKCGGRWQWTNFGDGTNNYLIMVNGADAPLYYNGSAWTVITGVSTPALSGVTLSDLVHVNEYKGRHVFYHMDLYRLEGPGALITSGLDEYLHMGGVVVIEWADRLPDIIPEWGLEVKFKILDERRRHLTFHGHHPRTLEILKALGKTQHTAP